MANLNKNASNDKSLTIPTKGFGQSRVLYAKEIIYQITHDIILVGAF
jgi:hypothetical protein